MLSFKIKNTEPVGHLVPFLTLVRVPSYYTSFRVRYYISQTPLQLVFWYELDSSNSDVLSEIWKVEMRRRPFPAAWIFSTGKLGCEDVLWCFSVAELQGPTSSFGGVRKPLRGRQQLNPVFQCHTQLCECREGPFMAVVGALGIGSWTQSFWKQRPY